MTAEKSLSTTPVTYNCAGGWFTEKSDSPVPPFLRVFFVSIASACIAYLILFMYGEVSHGERAPLMYSIAAVTALFFAGVSIFAAKNPQD